MKPDRRTFVNRLFGTSLGALLAALLSPVVTFLTPRPGLGTSSDEVRTPDGSPLEVSALGTGESTHAVLGGEKVLVVRRGEEDFLVLTATCTHLGCLVHYEGEQGELACPCHGGRYDLEGRVTGGPPPRPLERISVRRDGERLVRAE